MNNNYVLKKIPQSRIATFDIFSVGLLKHHVSEFIKSFVDTEQKRKDSFELIKLMRDFTGFEPKMWGPSFIGFGS